MDNFPKLLQVNNLKYTRRYTDICKNAAKARISLCCCCSRCYSLKPHHINMHYCVFLRRAQPDLKSAECDHAN